MASTFITKLTIREVAHLRDIEIELSESEKKHLILTGKNGSGKTSVLKSVSAYLKNFLAKVPSQLSVFLLHQREKVIIKDIDLHYSCTFLDVYKKYKDQQFIVYFSTSKRASNRQLVNVVKNISPNKLYDIDENANQNFLKFLVNQKVKSALAKNNGESEEAKIIDQWFETFENALRNLLGDKDLSLKFDWKNYNFTILEKGGKQSDFTTLSDGYSAIISLISELIMRLDDKYKNLDYTQAEGTVLIDEIETHLHIDLQKKILPFLDKFFPNIQFIVATHSPFVITSVDNAVVFDLEKKKRLDDNLTSYTYETIIENYYDSDLFSEQFKHDLDEFMQLLEKERLEEQELDDLSELSQLFRRYSKNALSDEVGLASAQAYQAYKKWTKTKGELYD